MVGLRAAPPRAQNTRTTVPAPARPARDTRPPARWRVRRRDGFSLTEVATILTALSVLTGAAAPAVTDYLAEARLVRARSDVRTLNLTLARLIDHTRAERDIDGGWGTYALLVGGGAVPPAHSAASQLWSVQAGRHVGLLDEQLIDNEPGYAVAETRQAAGWRGAYLEDRVAADPWGFRYAVNVGVLKTHNADVVVLSAGPDGVVHSLFESDGLPARGDDMASLVASGPHR